MNLIIHRSERILYSSRRSETLRSRERFRTDVWSFAPVAHSRIETESYSDVRTDSIPVPVVAPFGSEVIASEAMAGRIDWPEFRHRLKVYWDPTGIFGEQVWRLAVQGVRGFRLGAGVVSAVEAADAVLPAVETAAEEADDEPFMLVAMPGRARR